MAKRRTYKRDKRGRFSETLGGIASKAKARGNRTALAKAMRGRKNRRVDRRIDFYKRNEVRIDRSLSEYTQYTQNSRVKSPNQVARERRSNRAFHQRQISNLQNYGTVSTRKISKMKSKGRTKGQYGTRV